MMLGITGTPGTGKSTVSTLLKDRGYRVIHQNNTVDGYMMEDDVQRHTGIVDTDAWARDFTPSDGITEGHLTHLLPCDRVVVLRCRPDILEERLKKRGYKEDKISENCEAEALDVILIETIECHPTEEILELDCTDMTPAEVADAIEAFMRKERPPSHGSTDWSEFLGKYL
ncbi:MAG: adenylate kinase family protein [Methanogenium sp.]|nr:adenylate kinase family protein [Methanogenium sp.]